GPVRWTPGSTEWQAAHCPNTAAPRPGLPSRGCPATGETGPSDEIARRTGRTGRTMRATFMAFSWTPRWWRGGRVRGRRRRPTVLRVDRPPHLEQRLALAPQACHVTRDVETDRSRCGVAREGQRAVRVERLDVAVAVALVAEAVAAAEARDVLQLVAVLDGVPVQPLDLSGPRELGKLPPGQRLDLVADLVSGHRR